MYRAHYFFFSFLNQPRLMSMSLFWEISPIDSFSAKRAICAVPSWDSPPLPLLCTRLGPGKQWGSTQYLVPMFSNNTLSLTLSPQSRILSFLKELCLLSSSKICSYGHHFLAFSCALVWPSVYLAAVPQTLWLRLQRSCNCIKDGRLSFSSFCHYFGVVA